MLDGQHLLRAFRRYYQSNSDKEEQIFECMTELENNAVKKSFVEIMQMKVKD